MTPVQIPLSTKQFSAVEAAIMAAVGELRAQSHRLMAEDRVIDAMQRNVNALKKMREFPDFANTEFRAMLVALLFDLAEIHFALKNYKQSEKELDTIFKLLEGLIKKDDDRFGPLHILAMELSTRILRSRRKALEMLVKQQLTTSALYDKVNAGVAAATDKLVDSLQNAAQLLAQTGDIKAALKFYAEAIKFSKKRTGRVTRKEIKMTLDMAELMSRSKTMRSRAERLLNAVLPHAVALETLELERDILAMLEVLKNNNEPDSVWKNFLHKLATSLRHKKGENV